jgi:prepilin-type N-terminal cleavage/methylation domain-containing protein
LIKSVVICIRETLFRGNPARDESGFSLIEVLLAMLLVGILGTTIPSALAGANRATMTANQHTTAESLARSQMDYIQDQPYDSANTTPVYFLIPDIPASYSIVTPMAQRLDPIGDGVANDDGLQQITVAVMQGDKVVFTLVDFKVNFDP